METKYIFVVGGVMSGIGKGITTASIGRILKGKGFSVTALKVDPYINVDAGTMNPIEHGEVFVTKDGVECDQDVGNYERFLNQELTTANYITTGRVYQAVIQRERNLEYGGRCVEVVPDIPNEVIDRIEKAAKIDRAKFVLIEIGGTVGEYQNLLFLEAGRLMKIKKPNNVMFILVSYLPVPESIGEMKTKPTQQAMKWLNMAGIQADFVVARSVTPLDRLRKKKISVFCNVDEENVISAPNVDSIYEVPLLFKKEKFGDKILKKFGLKSRKTNLRDWKKLVYKIKNPKRKVKIGIVGKYFRTGRFTLMDSYISVIEAVRHASWFFQVEPSIYWLDAEAYEKNKDRLKELSNFDGVIVPGGFGKRGTEGKILAINYCRRKKIPFLGLCLGLQLSVIEFARNECGLRRANSTEIDKKTSWPVIDTMPEQKALLKEKRYGGTMRLGEYLCELRKGTIAFRAYKKRQTMERHRHRYEVNNDFRDILSKKGLIFSGTNPKRDLVEIIELPQDKHPFFLGTQFHPEFKSSPLSPHPLFKEFVRVSLNRKVK